MRNISLSDEQIFMLRLAKTDATLGTVRREPADHEALRKLGYVVTTDGQVTLTEAGKDVLTSVDIAWSNQTRRRLS